MENSLRGQLDAPSGVKIETPAPDRAPEPQPDASHPKKESPDSALEQEVAATVKRELDTEIGILSSRGTKRKRLALDCVCIFIDPAAPRYSADRPVAWNPPSTQAESFPVRASSVTSAPSLVAVDDVVEAPSPQHSFDPSDFYSVPEDDDDNGHTSQSVGELAKPEERPSSARSVYDRSFSGLFSEGESTQNTVTEPPSAVTGRSERPIDPRDQEIADLKARANGRRNTCRSLGKRVKELEKEKASLETMVLAVRREGPSDFSRKQWQNKVGQLEREIELLQSQVRTSRDNHQKFMRQSDNTIARLRNQLAEAEEGHAFAQSTTTSPAATTAHIQQLHADYTVKVRELEMQRDAILQKHDAVVRDREEERVRLERRLGDASANARAADEVARRARAEVAEARGTIRLLEAQLGTVRDALERTEREAGEKIRVVKDECRRWRAKWEGFKARRSITNPSPSPNPTIYDTASPPPPPDPRLALRAAQAQDKQKESQKDK
ncbi:hypothetical protein PYCC9005_005741 [Savitreella phatthalungensis]